MRLSRSFAVGVSVALFALCLGCSRAHDPKASAADPPPAVPVTVAPVAERTIPIQVRAIGNVEPYSTINVKAEMSGQLQKVYFAEGEMVEQGQKLFQVDPRPQQEMIRQLEANLAKDAAQARNAEAEAARYAELSRQGIVARQQSDQYQTTAAAWQATLDADRAAIQNARLQLQYTTTYAPITGRTGNLLIKEGNVVKANDLPLVTINQIEPIYVSFRCPNANCPKSARVSPRGSSFKRRPPATRIPRWANCLSSTTPSIRRPVPFEMKATFHKPRPPTLAGSVRRCSD